MCLHAFLLSHASGSRTGLMHNACIMTHSRSARDTVLTFSSLELASHAFCSLEILFMFGAFEKI